MKRGALAIGTVRSRALPERRGGRLFPRSCCPVDRCPMGRSRITPRALTMSCSTDRGTAPTTRSTTVPCLTNRMVGIDRMSYRVANPEFSSTLTFSNVTRPSEASASSARTGAIARHGPHHAAQKSRFTRPSFATSASSKFCSVRWIVPGAPRSRLPLMVRLLPPLRTSVGAGKIHEADVRMH
jgi:hypothetical protein